MPPNTVKVDRSTKYGNPFRVGKPVDMKLARSWGWNIDRAQAEATDARQAAARFGVALGLDHALHPQVKRELRGRNLACWCPLDGPCHADVLLEIANVEEATG